MSEKDKGEKIEIDFGAGKVSFSGMFKGIGSLIDLVSQIDQEGIHKTGGIKGLPKNARGVYGFSIRTLSGKPVIETFGNVRESTRGAVVHEVWEPIVDVFDEKERVVVVAELPGVAESEIKIDINGDILNITTSGKKKKYAKEVLLPARVKADTLKSTYKNGILEIILSKEG